MSNIETPSSLSYRAYIFYSDIIQASVLRIDTEQPLRQGGAGPEGHAFPVSVTPGPEFLLTPASSLYTLITNRPAARTLLLDP